jgi:TolB-like protein
MHLIFADCEIDLHRHELRRAASPVHVEPQVFDLLVYLVHNRDRVVSKDELLEHIWNGRIVSEAALSSRINAARKAIGDDGHRQDLIRTVHRRGFRFLGEVHQNADDPAAAPQAAAEAVAAVPEAEKPLVRSTAHRRPAVAVLPTVNAGGDPETEYFAYGTTEDIIRLIARNRWLDVLSRHSTNQFRDSDADPREIGAALGARYLVQCTVRRYGAQVRITADLVCTETARQLWSEVYDFALAEIFEVQEAITQRIAAVIEPELARLERDSAGRKSFGSLDAWESFQRGLFLLWGFTKPGLVEAETMFRHAIELDPDFARAHGALSYVYLQSAFLREPEERAALLDAALAIARISVLLDDRDCMNHCVLGRALVLHRDYEDGIACLEQAIALNPSFAQGYFALGHALLWLGDEAKAIRYFERAAELSPRDPHLFTVHDVRAIAHLSRGEHEQAVAFARKAVRLPNANYLPFATLVSAFGHLGRAEEARAFLEELLRRKPNYNCAHALGEFFYSRDERLPRLYVEGLRRGGLPETAALAHTEPPETTATPLRLALAGGCNRIRSLLLAPLAMTPLLESG